MGWGVAPAGARPKNGIRLGSGLFSLTVEQSLAKAIEDSQIRKDDDDKKALAAGAAGAGAAAYRYGRPTPYAPTTRRERRVTRRLQRTRRSTVRLKPKDYAAIAGGRGPRKQNDAYTARMALAMKRGEVPKGKTRVMVYGDRVKQLDGAHRAQAASMLGRRIPVKIEAKSKAPAPKLPKFAADKHNRELLEQRARLHDTRGMSKRRIKAEAAKYSESSARANLRQSRIEEQATRLVRSKKGKAALAGAAGAAALTAGGAATGWAV